MRFFIVFIFLQGAFVQISSAAEIHEAAKRGDTAKIVQLVKSGVDPNLKDNNGNTPFLVSVIHGKDLYEFLTIGGRSGKGDNFLFHQTGKIANDLEKNKTGQLWYHLAILHCNLALIGKFTGYIGYKDNLSPSRDIHFQNVLHYLAKSNCNFNYAKIVFYTMKSHQELIQQTDKSGKTPLQVAILSGTRGGQELLKQITNLAVTGAASK